MNKKDQIYQAALKWFNTLGYDKTPTSLIAKEAGVATGTLFHYFPTKEELINSLYLHCKELMVSRILEGVEGDKSYRPQFKRAYENMLRWGAECKAEFLFFQQFSNSPNILEATRVEGESRFKIIYDLIVRGISEEILKAVDPEWMLNAIFGLVSANILYLMQNPSLLMDQNFVDTTFTLVWDAIKR